MNHGESLKFNIKIDVKFECEAVEWINVSKIERSDMLLWTR
jgi:hypothetical protein